ncbi:MAG: hypothetical protein LBG48_02690, partial [Rickettsiales bacterium]|nr:hypothetical protein [Rickettsiales bacterium]
DRLKSNRSNGNHTSTAFVEVSTALTPALKIKKAFDLAVEGYEEELGNLRNVKFVNRGKSGCSECGDCNLCS